MRSIARMSLLVVLLALTGTNAFGLDKQDTTKAPLQGSTVVAPEPGFTVNPGKTAVLIMDYENDIVAMLPENVRRPLIEKANTILKEARKAKMPIIYVVVRFREEIGRASCRERV